MRRAVKKALCLRHRAVLKLNTYQVSKLCCRVFEGRAKNSCPRTICLDTSFIASLLNMKYSRGLH